ncbi:MAG: LacI family DNA-binding transcriptional regulator [Chthoniobacteraceae bacterium]
MVISQQKIADRVGVSRTAVSHVLNGRGHMVSAEVRENILEVAAALGYRRNALVRALRSNRSNVVGIIVPEGGVSFFNDIIRAAEDKAKTHGMQCFLCQSHSHHEALETQVSALLEYRVDGLLISPANPVADVELFKTLQAQQVPFVLIDSPAYGLEAPFVGNNNIAAGRLGAEHLVALGHKRIACARGYGGSWVAEQRVIGFRQVLKKAGIREDAKLMVGNGFEFENGIQAVQQLFDSRAQFTAVVAHSDLVALGVIRELARRGLRVPEDISVVGCANLAASAMGTPPLTTIDQKAHEMGSTAMSLLVQQIESKMEKPSTILIEPELIVRGTTAKRAKP